MGSLSIEKWDTEKDGELNEASMKLKLKKQGYNYSKHIYSPGTDFPDHTHAVSKKDAIVTGRMKFGMYGKSVVLEPGDMIVVPQNTVHNAHVEGEEAVVFFDATK